VWTAGATFGLALGPGVFGLVLQASGYVSAAGGEVLRQSAGTRTGIVLGATVLPAAVMALALPLLRGYDVTEARLRAQPVTVYS
jgi:Na+/melibiose symporter-like transporter